MRSRLGPELLPPPKGVLFNTLRDTLVRVGVYGLVHGYCQRARQREVKEELERAGVDVAEAVRRYLEELAWRTRLENDREMGPVAIRC